MKSFDPYDPRCSICNQQIEDEGLYAFTEPEDGLYLLCCSEHSEVGNMLDGHVERLMLGTTILQACSDLNCELSPGNALKVCTEKIQKFVNFQIAMRAKVNERVINFCDRVKPQVTKLID